MLASGIIILFFVIYWIVAYPVQIADALLFRYNIFICFITWVWFVAALSTLCYLIDQYM